MLKCWEFSNFVKISRLFAFANLVIHFLVAISPFGQSCENPNRNRRIIERNIWPNWVGCFPVIGKISSFRWREKIIPICPRTILGGIKKIGRLARKGHPYPLSGGNSKKPTLIIYLAIMRDEPQIGASSVKCSNFGNFQISGALNRKIINPKNLRPLWAPRRPFLTNFGEKGRRGGPKRS